ncbi:hypothetical protein AGMMS49593_02340 [Endomicrobiia bacterium]|nr:hypothetical protein AGMMS49593_02340 [Endomicrobiia bacterium]
MSSYAKTEDPEIKDARECASRLVKSRGSQKRGDTTFFEAKNQFTKRGLQIPLDKTSSKDDMQLHRFAAEKDKAGNIWVFGIFTYCGETYYTLERGNFNETNRLGPYAIKKGRYPVISHKWNKDDTILDVFWIQGVKGRKGIFGHDGTGPWHSKGCVLFLFQKGEVKEIHDKLNEHGGKATINITNAAQVDRVFTEECDRHSQDPDKHGEIEQPGEGCGSWDEDTYDETSLVHDPEMKSNIVSDSASVRTSDTSSADNSNITAESDTSEGDDKTDIGEVVPTSNDISSQTPINTSSSTLLGVSISSDVDVNSSIITQQNQSDADREPNVNESDQAQGDSSSNASNNPAHTAPTIVSDKASAGGSTKIKTKAKTKTKKKTKTCIDINYDKSLYYGSTNYHPSNVNLKKWAREQNFPRYEVKKYADNLKTKILHSIAKGDWAIEKEHVSNPLTTSGYITPASSSVNGISNIDNSIASKSSSNTSFAIQTAKKALNFSSNDNKKVNRQNQNKNKNAPMTLKIFNLSSFDDIKNHLKWDPEQNRYVYDPDECEDNKNIGEVGRKDDDSSPSSSSESLVESTSNQEAKADDIISLDVTIEPSPADDDDKTIENQDSQHPDITPPKITSKSQIVSGIADNDKSEDNGLDLNDGSNTVRGVRFPDGVKPSQGNNFNQSNIEDGYKAPSCPTGDDGEIVGQQSDDELTDTSNAPAITLSTVHNEVNITDIDISNKSTEHNNKNEYSGYQSEYNNPSNTSDESSNNPSLRQANDDRVVDQAQVYDAKTKEIGQLPCECRSYAPLQVQGA